MYCPFKFTANKKCKLSKDRYFNCKAKLVFQGEDRGSEFVFNEEKSNFEHNHPIKLEVRLNRFQESIEKICKTGRGLSNKEISNEFRR